MQEIAALERYLKGFDWFHSIGVDPYGRHVVYVQYMNIDTLTTVPDYCDGKQVLIHFAASLTSKADDFKVNVSPAKPQLETWIAPELPTGDLPVLDLSEIEDLLKTGPITKPALIDMFYEIHDGDDAVTFVSESFPKEREKLEALYNTYGFDVLHDLLEK